MEHIIQQKELGILKFILEYAKELIKNGYYLNKFEVKARFQGLVNRKNYFTYDNTMNINET